VSNYLFILFIRIGIIPEKLLVTGIPNFDHADQYRDNEFPHQGYVLITTSDARETFKKDCRNKFLQWALAIAGDRPLIFKLHPNENKTRAIAEIQTVAPHAHLFTEGNTEHMIANCDALITQYSSCIYNGLALGKECHSYFDVDMLRDPQNLIPSKTLVYSMP